MNDVDDLTVARSQRRKVAEANVAKISQIAGRGVQLQVNGLGVALAFARLEMLVDHLLGARDDDTDPGALERELFELAFESRVAEMLIELEAKTRTSGIIVPGAQLPPDLGGHAA